MSNTPRQRALIVEIHLAIHRQGQDVAELLTLADIEREIVNKFADMGFDAVPIEVKSEIESYISTFDMTDNTQYPLIDPIDP